jgi:hypothetical protein
MKQFRALEVAMKRMPRIFCILTLLIASLGGGHDARAALSAVSPALNPAAGNIPTWYQDQGGLALQPCLDVATCGLGAAGVVGVFDPALPLAFPGNFPPEFFYYSATTAAAFTINGAKALVTQALEASFVDAAGNAVNPNVLGATGSTFQRIRVQIDSPAAAGTYTLQHFWGEFTFDCPTAGVRCRFTRDIPAAAVPPINFSLALGAAFADSMSTFPQQTVPAPPVGFVGDGVTEAPVTLSPPAVRNVINIIPPAPLPLIANTRFVVVGQKIGMDVTPTPVADLGGAVVDVTPTQVPVTVTNLTGAPMTLLGTAPPALQFTGKDAADFTAAPPAAAGANSCINGTLQALAPNNTCTFNVLFKPVASTVAVRNAKLTITPDVTTNSPPTSISLTGEAEFPITVEVEANGALKKVLATGNIAAVSENVDAGSVLTYLPVPNDVVPNVSKYRPLVRVNGQTLKPAADGTFSIPAIGAAQFVDIDFVRPGDVAVSPASGIGDGQVTIVDALEALRIVTGLNAAPTDAQKLAADVGPLADGKPTADGLIDVSDVLAILWRTLQPPVW